MKLYVLLNSKALQYVLKYKLISTIKNEAKRLAYDRHFRDPRIDGIIEACLDVRHTIQFNSIRHGRETAETATVKKLQKPPTDHLWNALTLAPRYAEIKKSVPVKNPNAHFTLKISASQDLEPMLVEYFSSNSGPRPLV